MIGQEREGSLSVKNALGEEVKVYPGWSSGRWDWMSKYLTQDCPHCADHIPRAEAEPVLRLVAANKGRRYLHLPEDQRGLCLCSPTGRTSILIDHPCHGPRKCQYFDKPRHKS